MALVPVDLNGFFLLQDLRQGRYVFFRYHPAPDYAEDRVLSLCYDHTLSAWRFRVSTGGFLEMSINQFLNILPTLAAWFTRQGVRIAMSSTRTVHNLEVVFRELF